MVEFVHLDYCGNCPNPLTKDTDTRYFCETCGSETFNSPSAGATALVFDGDKVLMSVRAIEPRKGGVDTIGGFLDYMEDPYETVVREFREETGGEITNIELVSAATVRYTKNQSAVDMMFIGDLVSDAADLQPKDDVAELTWIAVSELKHTDIEPQKIPGILLAHERYLQRQSVD